MSNFTITHITRPDGNDEMTNDDRLRVFYEGDIFIKDKDGDWYYAEADSYVTGQGRLNWYKINDMNDFFGRSVVSMEAAIKKFKMHDISEYVEIEDVTEVWYFMV